MSEADPIENRASEEPFSNRCFKTLIARSLEDSRRAGLKSLDRQ